MLKPQLNMDLHGKNLIGGKLSARGAVTFNGVNPATRELLPPAFHEATETETDLEGGRK